MLTADQIFELAYSFDRKAEGGLSNNPDDPGGLTNAGITQATYTAWLAAENMPSLSVENISEDEIREILYEEYWLKCHFDQIAAFAPATAISLFDFGENIGDIRPIEMFQSKLNVTADGMIGPGTRVAARTIIGNFLGGDLAFAIAFNADRLAWYNKHSKQTFIHGLQNRVEALNVLLKENFT